MNFHRLWGLLDRYVVAGPWIWWRYLSSCGVKSRTCAPSIGHIKYCSTLAPSRKRLQMIYLRWLFLMCWMLISAPCLPYTDVTKHTMGVIFNGCLQAPGTITSFNGAPSVSKHDWWHRGDLRHTSYSKQKVVTCKHSYRLWQIASSIIQHLHFMDGMYTTRPPSVSWMVNIRVKCTRQGMLLDLRDV